MEQFQLIEIKIIDPTTLSKCKICLEDILQTLSTPVKITNTTAIYPCLCSDGIHTGCLVKQLQARPQIACEVCLGAYYLPKYIFKALENKNTDRQLLIARIFRLLFTLVFIAIAIIMFTMKQI